MPESKHHKKKAPHSLWRNRSNKRRYNGRLQDSKVEEVKPPTGLTDINVHNGERWFSRVRQVMASKVLFNRRAK